MTRGQARRRIVNDFVAARATVPSRAIVYRAEHIRMFRRLRAHGAIVEIGPGRFHLDADRLVRFRRTVRLRVVMVFTASGLVASTAAAMTLVALVE